MSIEIKVPRFPESVADGIIVTWHKRPGQAVAKDEVLVDIETDKVMFEIPAPQAGILQQILHQAGETVVSDQLIGHIVETATQAANDNLVSVPVSGDQTAAHVAVAPAARKLIMEHGLNTRDITGSGRDGRILKEDVQKHLDARSASSRPPAIEPSPPPRTEQREAVSAPVPVSIPTAAVYTRLDEREKRVPMTRLRARIAERLVEAQHTAAMLTTFNEINMTPVTTLRNRYREVFEKRYGVRLGYMSFFVKAVVEALKRFPIVNASIDGKDIVYHGFFDIGIAVSTERGLIVPILRDADRLAMSDIEQKLAEYATQAKQGTISIEDITGGTFTITNGGVFGSLLSTPILNPPQSAILGMHKIQERPVVENGAIIARPMMYLALSYDHRIIDGKDAVQFLVTIKDLLEDPARLLLEV